MLKTKKIEIAIHTKIKKNYPDLPIGSVITIDISELSKGSSKKVDVICDNCFIDKSITYCDYNYATKNETRNYYCNKCSYLHSICTLNELYGIGIDNPMDIPGIKTKHKTSISKIDKTEADKKRRITNQIKYNTEYVQQNPTIREKTRTTVYKSSNGMYEYSFLNEKYSQKRIDSSNSIKTKTKRTETFHTTIISKVSEQYGIDIIDYDGETYTSICENDHIYKIDDTLLYNRFKYNNTLCTICNVIGYDRGTSKLESNIKDYVKSIYIGKIVENTRSVISPYELDIYLPEKNIAIEINGMYWHSERFRDINYQKNKVLKCADKSILLYTIWEDQWISDDTNIKEYLNNIINNEDINIDISGYKTITFYYDKNNNTRYYDLLESGSISESGSKYYKIFDYIK